MSQQKRCDAYRPQQDSAGECGNSAGEYRPVFASLELEEILSAHRARQRAGHTLQMLRQGGPNSRQREPITPHSNDQT